MRSSFQDTNIKKLPPIVKSETGNVSWLGGGWYNGHERGIISRMETTFQCPVVRGGRREDVSELLRSRHSYPNILGTNPDQFYLNTIRRVDQDYCNYQPEKRLKLTVRREPDLTLFSW